MNSTKHHRSIVTILFVAACLSAASSLQAAVSVTGNPAADGWTAGGHSLANGVYVTGSGNYGFQTFSAGVTIQAGSSLEISAGSLSWLAGDTVLGVGGKFESITAAEAGWTAFSGGAVNALLPKTAPYVGPKLQAKFGTSSAAWTTSTAAPGAGNGTSSSSAAWGRVQVRTSGYFQTGTPNPGQTEPWTWDGNSGQLLVPDKSTHVSWNPAGSDVSLDKRVARMIWVWDGAAKQVATWELLLNVSLMDRLNPTYTGLLPSIGDKAIMTVQPGDSGNYTDAVVTVVPEPATMTLLALGGLAALGRRKRS